MRADECHGAGLPCRAVTSGLSQLPAVIPQSVTVAPPARHAWRPLPFQPAFLAYNGSVFIGLLTPGRIGEAVNAAHVARDCEIPVKSAISSVLADRLFDVYALLLMGGLALFTLPTGLGLGGALGVGWFLALLTIALVALLHPWIFRHMQAFGCRLGKLGWELFKPGGWVESLRNGLKLTPTSVALTIGLTIAVLPTHTWPRPSKLEPR